MCLNNYFCSNFLKSLKIVYLNSLYKGLKKDLYSKLDFLRKRNLTHDALEDAKDNAKIFHELRKKFFKKNA